MRMDVLENVMMMYHGCVGASKHVSSCCDDDDKGIVNTLPVRWDDRIALSRPVPQVFLPILSMQPL